MASDLFKEAGENFVAMARSELKGALGRGKRKAELLAKMGRLAAKYWKQSAQGDSERAEENLRFVKANLALILEGQHVSVRRRANIFLDRALKMGLALAKAVV